jgi:hypothetical protein
MNHFESELDGSQDTSAVNDLSNAPSANVALRDNTNSFSISDSSDEEHDGSRKRKRPMNVT